MRFNFGNKRTGKIQYIVKKRAHSIKLVHSITRTTLKRTLMYKMSHIQKNKDKIRSKEEY